MRYYSKPRTNWKEILKWIAIVVVGLLLISALGAAVAPKNDDEFKKISVEWSIGGLTTEGRFDKDATDTLVSEAISVDGDTFKFIPDDNANITYTVYTFDENMVLISVEDEFTSRTTIEASDLGEDVEYIRIVLNPGDENEDIEFLEQLKYQNLLTVKRLVVDEEKLDEDNIDTTT